MNIVKDELNVIVYVDSMVLSIPAKDVDYLEKTSPNYILSYDKLKQTYHLYYNLKNLNEIRVDGVVRYSFDIYLKTKDYNTFSKLFRRDKIEKLLNQ